MLASAVLILALAACATSPFDPYQSEVAELGPADALRQPSRAGAQVIWGGRIAAIGNREGWSEIEVVALPLGRADRPRENAEGGVRFVIVHSGFLDPMIYEPGREVTALGTFREIETRRVGEFPVDMPVLVSRQIELWPIERRGNTGFSIGVGIGL
ncbi:MAG: Slp family lipoprotein [Wenzhouxiangellaceae bacterium]|nr:Slp family lipoprotein [Wenzhouxiangellaceae bacterium]